MSIWPVQFNHLDQMTISIGKIGNTQGYFRCDLFGINLQKFKIVEIFSKNSF